MDGLVEVLGLVLLFGWPGILIGMHMIRGQINDKHKRLERAEARRSYERLMHRKLDVVETALAMGYTRDEVKELDARLERLIGADKMKSLLDGTTPVAPELTELVSDDQLRAEIKAIRRERQRG
jgi:hypothetical protein